MATLSYSQNILTHVEVETVEVGGQTVGEALDSIFAENRRLQSYLVNDDGSLRKHVAIFVDGAAIKDRQEMSDALPEDGEIFVMQALSGG